MLKLFIEKVYFTYALKRFCVVESSFLIVAKLNETNTKKKKYFSFRLDHVMPDEIRGYST